MLNLDYLLSSDDARVVVDAAVEGQKLLVLAMKAQAQSDSMLTPEDHALLIGLAWDLELVIERAQTLIGAPIARRVGRTAA